MVEKNIPVGQLDFDLKNPRHGQLSDQEAAFRALIVDQGSKLTRLALDIYEIGISPVYRFLVTPSSDERYTVLDGNRRLAALHLLANPHLVPSGPLSSTFADRVTEPGNQPTSLACTVLDSRDDAKVWLERIHSGERDGIGLVSWSPMAQYRFGARVSDHTMRGALTLVWLQERTRENTKLQEQILEVENNKITNLGRIAADPDIRKFLGFDIKLGQFTVSSSDEEVVESLSILIDDLAARSVSELKSKEQRREYIEKIFGKSILNNDEEDDSESEDSETDGNGAAKSGSEQEDPDNGEQGQPGDRGQEKTNTKGQSDSDTGTSSKSNNSGSRRRSTKIYLFQHLDIDGLGTRVTDIIEEVREIDIAKLPNAGAVLLRCTIELAAEQYISSFGMKPDRELVKKIGQVIAREKIAQDDDRYYGVRAALSSPNSPLALKSLHQAVHNMNYHPTSTDLRGIANNFKPFIEDIAKALLTQSEERDSDICESS